MVCGLPGSGKSYFATRLADQLGADYLSSDRLRREASAAVSESRRDPTDETSAALYSNTGKTRVYDLMLERLRAAPLDLRPVVLDATFSMAPVRENFYSAARELHARLCIIRITADEELTRQRVSEPRPESDADYAVYLKLRNQYEPIREPHLVLESTNDNIQTLLRRAVHYLYGEPLIAQDIETLRESPVFTRPPRLIETHISWVLLDTELVYKIKKPVRFSFLDFATLSKRRYYCRREVRLNSRLSTIYRGVVALRRDSLGRLCFSSTPQRSPAIDFAVVMDRIDERYEMDRMLADDRVHEAELRALGRVLAEFHREHAVPVACEASPDDRAPGDARVLRDEFADLENAYRAVRERLIASDEAFFQHAGTRPAALSPADWIVRTALVASETFLAGHAESLRRRRELGLVRDCHGDCHSRNIFLPPNQKPILFDCVEFNDEFRQIDVLNEVAFLCMDLDAAGHEQLSQTLLDEYLAAQPAPGIARSVVFDAALFDYFLSYRANIRAKVALLRIAQTPVDDQAADAARSIQEVVLYLNLMAGYVARFDRRERSDVSGK